MDDITFEVTEECCGKTLRMLRERADLTKVVFSSLASSPFARILGPYPPTGPTVFTQADWEHFNRAARRVPRATRQSVRLLTAGEAANHKDGDLGRFWAAMHRAFS